MDTSQHKLIKQLVRSVPDKRYGHIKLLGSDCSITLVWYQYHTSAFMVPLQLLLVWLLHA